MLRNPFLQETRLSDVGFLMHLPDAPSGSLKDRVERDVDEVISGAPGSYALTASMRWSRQYENWLTDHGGGVMISTNVMLTCAHTSADVVPGGFEPNADRFEVSVGVTHRSELRQRFAVNKILVHPHYEGSRTAYRDDLALWFLDGHVPLKHVMPLVPDRRAYEAEVGEDVVVWGMGKRSDGSNELHQVLRKVVMTVIEARGGILLLKPKTGQFEQGDSGGPAFDADEAGAYMGDVTHFFEDPELGRVGALIPSPYGLGWALTAAPRFDAFAQMGGLREATA